MPYPYPGLNPTGYTAAYGGVPTVPSPISTQQEAIAGDIGQLGSLYDLSRGVSNAAAGGARAQYEANLPQYIPLTSQASTDIMSNLRGEVPSDVINLLGRQAAERGVGFGPSSPNANAAYLSALGQTSLGLKNLGQQQLTQAIQRTPTGPMFNPASMLISPQQMQDAAMYASTLGAAPVPSAAAAASEAAARRGLTAGVGAGGGTGYPRGGGAPTPLGGGGGGYGPGGPPMVVGGSTGTGLTYGGVPYYGGSTPGSAGQNWEQWASNMFGRETPGDTSDIYGYGNFLSPEDYNYVYGLDQPIGPIMDEGLSPMLDSAGNRGGSFWDDFWSGTGVGGDMFSDMGSTLEDALMGGG